MCIFLPCLLFRFFEKKCLTNPCLLFRFFEKKCLTNPCLLLRFLPFLAPISQTMQPRPPQMHFSCFSSHFPANCISNSIFQVSSIFHNKFLSTYRVLSRFCRS